VSVTATEAERHELNDLFAELCRIESPSGHERECADRITRELRAMGVTVTQDAAGPLAGSDCGNLLAHIEAGPIAGQPASPPRTVMLCAHMDTVPPTAPVEPVLLDGVWENARDTILGADNKAAIAVMLMVARRAARGELPVGLELLFTVGEERALAGARALDMAGLRSDFGYVFDHATPIGEVITGSPTQYRLEATFRGTAAHAGIRPEAGRSAIIAAARAIAAMRLGRVDDQTTANVGEISGGTAMNVIPERCSLVAEARSLDEAKVDLLVSEMVDHLHDAANLPECECDLDISVARMYEGYRLSGCTPALSVAEGALRDCGYEPKRRDSGGGSDANVFQARGRSVVNLANGTERAHEPDERVSVQALWGMLDVALNLAHRAAG
jgi:tripeptide aminopeptidase